MELTSRKVSRVDAKSNKQALVGFDESTNKANMSITNNDLLHDPETEPYYEERNNDLKIVNNLKFYAYSFCFLSLILCIIFNLISLLVVGNLSETYMDTSERDQRVQ